jgi:energy-converting hydrogenase Eha subunit B
MLRVYEKSARVLAIQLTWDTWNEVCEFVGANGQNYFGVYIDENNQKLPWGHSSERIGLVIKTLEGDMLAAQGDYIIKGVEGEFYPCKPEIFEKTYKVVEGLEYVITN